MDGLIRVDMNGIPFKYPGIELDTREFSKIVKEINNVYYPKYENKSFAMHRSLDLEDCYCIYYFEIRGFNDYNIIDICNGVCDFQQ